MYKQVTDSVSVRQNASVQPGPPPGPAPGSGIPVINSKGTPNVSQTQEQPTKLTGFLGPETAPELLEITARYAQDPTTFLTTALGEEAFNTRKDQGLLSLPEKVDLDVYGKGEYRQHFEKHIANLLGKQQGLFFLTGVQAQLIALRIYCQQAGHKRVAWHVTSHLEEAEERAFEELYGLERSFLGSSPDVLPTVEEIKAVAEQSEDKRPAAIVIEVPNRSLGCRTYTFSELEAISSACRAAGVKLHCDGARLWEIEPYYQSTAGKTFKDIGALFDSVYVSFYKGLRGTAGAMLAHDDADFMIKAKVWQRRAGGNAFSLVHHVVDCERGYNVNIGTFERKWGKMKEVAEQVVKATEKYKTKEGRPVVSFEPKEPTCCQIFTAFSGFTSEELEGARDRAQTKTGIRVFERLRSRVPVDVKLQAEREAAAKGEKAPEDKDLMDGKVDDGKHSIEWMVTSAIEKTETEVFVKGYVALCEELIGGGRPPM